ncbi:MAG: hypothetical protein IKX57_08470 [Oscillospiraceae bacterium]|nr:hypothetical protein [Oscillospiraceae bacterium]MBR5723653.1 hypothetical protein [Oscillospiraceae bacterium]
MAMGIQPEELIAEYCDLDAVSRALHRGDAAAAEAEIDKAMQAFLAEDPDAETLALLVNCLFVVLQYHVFYTYLDEKSFALGEQYADRLAMRKDWEAWNAGAALSDAAWITPAAEQTKTAVFEAIRALHLTADDFDEVPAPEMKEPKWQKKTYGDFELVTIADAEITDDGGLAKDKSPEGKSYILKDADGVTYYLNNIRKSAVPGGLDAEEEHLYTADGWIDGYTGKQPREIEFEIYDGGFIFTYSTDGTDDSCTAQDPRWMPYEIWVQSRIARRRAQQKAFLAKYGH